MDLEKKGAVNTIMCDNQKSFNIINSVYTINCVKLTNYICICFCIFNIMMWRFSFYDVTPKTKSCIVLKPRVVTDEKLFSYIYVIDNWLSLTNE